MKTNNSTINKIALLCLFFASLNLNAQQRITYTRLEFYDSLLGWHISVPQYAYQKTLDKYTNGRIVERLKGRAPEKESNFSIDDRYEYKYNSKGQVVEIKYQNPSSYQLGKSLGTSTEAFQYSESGKITEKQLMVYDSNTQEYFLQNKTQYRYNANQQLIEAINFVWDTPNQKLIEAGKDQYVYNAAGQLLYQIESGTRLDFAYGADGTTKETFTRFYKSHQQFNTRKQLIFQLDSMYYELKNKWIFFGSTENSYNEKGKLVQETRHSEIPDDGTDVPFYINDNRTVYEYDENDSLQRKTSLVGQPIFNPNQSTPQVQWLNNGREIYSYEILAEDADNRFPDMFLYPNPTSGKALLTNLIEQGCATKVDILDTKGIIVKAYTRENPEYIGTHTQCKWDLDLSNLPDGIYFVRIQNAEGQYFAKKILLQK